MKLIARILLVITVFSMWSLIILLDFNPHGWGQRVVWGMKPPYHWIGASDTGPLDEAYVDSNGKACANVYHFPLIEVTYRVYGKGFGLDTATREEAEAIAQRECR